MVPWGGSVGRFIVTAAIVSLLSPCLAGSSDCEEPPTPACVIELDLGPIRNFVRNIQAKIQNDVVGIAKAGEAKIEGWAVLCCTRNVLTLRKLTRSLERNATNLLKISRKAGREDGARGSASLIVDAKAFQKILEQFAAAPDRASAITALGNLNRAVRNLEKDRKDLESCCNDLTVPSSARPTR